MAGIVNHQDSNLKKLAQRFRGVHAVLLNGFLRTSRSGARTTAGLAMVTLSITAMLGVGIGLVGCQGESTAEKARKAQQAREELTSAKMPVAYVDADGSHESLTRDTTRNPYPHLKFADGRISLNDKCPVRKVGLNVKLPGLFVNGRPIGFC